MNRTDILWQVLESLTMSTFSMTARVLQKYTLPKPNLVTLGGTNVPPTTSLGQPKPAVDYKLNHWLTSNHTIRNPLNYKYPKDGSLNHRKLFFLILAILANFWLICDNFCFSRDQDPEVIYLKHVERSAQQQQRREEEVSRYISCLFTFFNVSCLFTS